MEQNKMKNQKHINDYTLEEYKAMENFGEDSVFNSIIIVPTDEIHDSGFRCMKFILLNNMTIVGVVGGGSDVIHPNGWGNYGLNWEEYYRTGRVPCIDISMDCLTTSGCIRLMMRGKYQCKDFILSDFIFYKVEENDE